MRLLFHQSTGEWSASSRAFAVAARGLAARGDEVIIACCSGGTAQEGFAATGLEVIPVSAGTSYGRDTMRLRTLLTERSPDAVFLHTEREHVIVSAAMRLGKGGTIVRRIATGAPAALTRTGRLAGRISQTRLLFTTEADKARAPNDVQSFVAPLGVDVSQTQDTRARTRERLGIKDKTDLMVCVIDKSAGSRLVAVMRTIALLGERHPNLRLAVVGSDADADDTRMHAAALGVTSLVRVLGSRADAREICAAADSGWVAAEGDDAAFACLDFMSARVPIIGERSPSVSHFVPDGIAGVLLPPADPSEIAAIVARFLVDKDARSSMGNAGYTRVTRDFTEQAMIDGFAAAAGSAAATPVAQEAE